MLDVSPSVVVTIAEVLNVAYYLKITRSLALILVCQLEMGPCNLYTTRIITLGREQTQSKLKVFVWITRMRKIRFQKAYIKKETAGKKTAY